MDNLLRKSYFMDKVIHLFTHHEKNTVLKNHNLQKNNAWMQ